MGIRIRVVVSIAVIFSILILLYLVLGGGSDNHNEFDNIVSEYSNIYSLDIYGSSPSLFISFEIDEDTTIEDVNLVFQKTRDIFLEKETFDNLMNFHKERYGGTVTDVHIIFTYEGNGYYDYYSFNEMDGAPSMSSFNYWIVDRNGEEQHYMR